MNAAGLIAALPLCSLSIEYSLGCSPKRRVEPRDLLRGPTTILIAGNRIQFSRTEGKDFPSERVAVFSLSRLCCQRLCETFFSPRLLRSLFSLPFPEGKRGGWRVRSGSRYLVSVVFAVKDFVKLSSSEPPFQTFPGRAASCEALGVGGVRSGRRCMLPVGVSRQVLLSLSVVFQKTPQFQGVPIRKDSTSVQ